MTWEHRWMLVSFAHLAFSAMLRLLVGRRRSSFANEIELLVLRHQVAVKGSKIVSWLQLGSASSVSAVMRKRWVQSSAWRRVSAKTIGMTG
jgi:hypothetical protein